MPRGGYGEFSVSLVPFVRGDFLARYRAQTTKPTGVQERQRA